MISFEKDQIYIVTGASSGIGEGTALLLNKLGATVVAIARNEKRLNEMKSKSVYPENIHIETRDLAENISELPEYIKELKLKYGKFSGLAYCAGTGLLQPLIGFNLEETKKVFDINYFAAIAMAKGFADKRNNIGKGSSAVFVSSFASVIPSKGQLTYAGTKAALDASIKVIASEYVSKGIRFNTVQPSEIATPLLDERAAFLGEKKLARRYPLGIGEVDDVANFIAFLLSDATKWITKQSYVIDCGSE